MNLPALDPEGIGRVVSAALREDLGEHGDVTTAAVAAPGTDAEAIIVAREQLVVAGLQVAEAVFAHLSPDLAWIPRSRDGDVARPGETLAAVQGPAAPILEGERTALNFLMRMCGIASAARRAVREVQGTGAQILDTRKTAPGLRVLDKYAVAAGGAVNHRMGLYDAVMIKDTHVAVAGSVGVAVERALQAGHPPGIITAEVRTVGQLHEAMEAGAGRALLDNMNLDAIEQCVRAGRGRIVLEASGGLRPGALAAIARAGVDYLSLGWLTHSSRAADIAMEIDVRNVERPPHS